MFGQITSADGVYTVHVSPAAMRLVEVGGNVPGVLSACCAIVPRKVARSVTLVSVRYIRSLASFAWRRAAESSMVYKGVR